MEKLFLILLIAVCGVVADPRCSDISAHYCPYTAKCYTVSVNTTDFQRGEFSCLQKNGHLASIHVMLENMFIRDAAVDVIGPPNGDAFDDFWIGGLYVSNGTYGWTDNSAFSFNVWQPQEPSTSVLWQCVGMSRNTGQWKTNDCMWNLHYVCEVPLAGATTPMPYTNTPLPLTTTPWQFTTTPYRKRN